MSDDKADKQPEPDLTPAEIRVRVEFCCWMTLALVPFLYWINGPAVSSDQFVVRTALVVLAAIGAIGLRIAAWLGRSRN